VELLYSLPVNSFTLIYDGNNKIYLTKINSYDDVNLDSNSQSYKEAIEKENTRIKNSILKSYDLFLNDKYNVNVNQTAINNVKNLFQ
jgi:peptidyl-prolyl cis-trans isomerase D